jgi:hypothetical protein
VSRCEIESEREEVVINAKASTSRQGQVRGGEGRRQRCQLLVDPGAQTIHRLYSFHPHDSSTRLISAKL